MATVHCAYRHCGRSILVDGTGGVLRKTIKNGDGEREAVFFCCHDHLKWDGRPDIGEESEAPPSKIVHVNFGSR